MNYHQELIEYFISRKKEHDRIYTKNYYMTHQEQCRQYQKDKRDNAKVNEANYRQAHREELRAKYDSSSRKKLYDSKKRHERYLRDKENSYVEKIQTTRAVE